MKKYILSIAVITVIAVLGSCKKEKIAPDLKAISQAVSMETPFAVNTSTPDFSVGQRVYFSGTFKGETYWVITVTGATSGAVKTFFGTGTSIVNATWDGSADRLPSFGAEAVTAVLSFPRSVTTATVSLGLTIAGAKNNDAGHVLITDFSTVKFNGPGSDPDVFWPSDWVATTAKNNIPYPNPDGNQYCMMGPNGAWQPNADFPGHNSPYIDFLTISANSQGYPTYFPLIADPTKIYFNMMVYYDATPSAKDMWLQVILHEEHPTIAGTIIAKSVNVKFNGPANTPAGWNLLSVKYLDFKYTDTTQTFINPQKIKDIQLVLLSNAKQDILDAGTNPVSATFDHLVFTHYKPYQP